MPDASKGLSRTLSLTAAIAFLLAAYWCLRVGYADWEFRQDTADSVERAVELAPGSTEYRSRLGELVPHRARREWEEAVARNPYDAEAWIQLALLAEADGSYDVAERRLLEAARVDNTLLPRWSLASFYFRRRNDASFWVWARKANEMSTGDTTALYRLCWRLTDNAGLILARVIPDESDHLVRYLLFVMKDGHLEAGLEVARRLIEIGGEQYRGVLVGYCEELLIAKNLGRAVEVWNLMAQCGLLPHEPLRAAASQPLTDPGFEQKPLGRGFAWRLVDGEGISVLHTPGSVRLSFSGRQADHLELLQQYVLLKGDSAYRIAVLWTGGPPPDSGLRWQIADLDAGRVLALEGDPFEFRTQPKTRFGLLKLRYDRPPGASALRGNLAIESVTLERVPPGE